MTLFEDFREPVKQEIRRLLPLLLAVPPALNGFASVVLARLEDYTLRGKLIRGCLIPFTCYHLYGAEVLTRDTYSLAAAVELFQSMLLVHDDIMDQDELRRGRAAIHSLYSADGKKKQIENYQHYGESMGICFGDVATFAAFGIIAHLSCPPQVIQKILQCFSEELIRVGLAQMQDMHNAELSPELVSMDDIVNTYRYKTGRYTFSLPMRLGALLCGNNAEIGQKLELLGEYLGIIFQVKDDEIGLFGDPVVTGKPNDSDLAAGKKTVFIQCLMSALSSVEKAELTRVLADYRGSEDMEWVKNQMKIHAVQDSVRSLIADYKEKCLAIITTLPAQPLQEGLKELMMYNLNRGR